VTSPDDSCSWSACTASSCSECRGRGLTTVLGVIGTKN
jgi:hypothetical protein